MKNKCVGLEHYIAFSVFIMKLFIHPQNEKKKNNLFEKYAMKNNTTCIT